MKQGITQANIKRQKRVHIEKDVLTPREVARATGIGLLTIYGMLKSNQLPSVKVGKCFYVSRAVYQEWLASFGTTRKAKRSA